MNKKMMRGVIAAGTLLALYLLIAFLVPFAHTGVFWASFIFTLIAFCVVGYAFYTAFVRNPDAKSKFYGFPVARIGVIYGIAQLILGFAFMTLATFLPVPAWIAVLVFAVALGAAVIGLVAAETVVEEIKRQDVVLKKNVSFMRELQSKVNQMAAQSDLPEVKKFAEDVRFSDPVSSDDLADCERDLKAVVDDLQAAVVDGDEAAIKALCRKASFALSERNRLCKLGKGNR